MKIGDFGSSKHIPHSDTSTRLTTLVGTASYMAPEVDGEERYKADHLDIWALGCILYRMFAGSLLFRSRRDVWIYAFSASSPPQAVKDKGFSDACVDFLGDVLQQEPENRPSAEDCLKKPWIMSRAPGPEYSIGRDLYERLFSIQVEAPDINSF